MDLLLMLWDDLDVGIDVAFAVGHRGEYLGRWADWVSACGWAYEEDALWPGGDFVGCLVGIPVSVAAIPGVGNCVGNWVVKGGLVDLGTIEPIWPGGGGGPGVAWGGEEDPEAAEVDACVEVVGRGLWEGPLAEPVMWVGLCGVDGDDVECGAFE